MRLLLGILMLLASVPIWISSRFISIHRQISSTQEQKEIWWILSELFFLDIDQNQEDFKRAAIELRKYCNKSDFSRIHTIFIREVAPVLGRSFGYFFYPASPNWSGYSKQQIASTIDAYRQTKFHQMWQIIPILQILSDRFYSSMAHKLDFESLKNEFQKLT